MSRFENEQVEAGIQEAFKDDSPRQTACAGLFAACAIVASCDLSVP